MKCGVSWNKYRIYRLAVAEGESSREYEGKPDAKVGGARGGGEQVGVSYELKGDEKVGEEVDDDDDVRSFLGGVWITSSASPDWKWKPPNGGNDIKSVTELKFLPPPSPTLPLSLPHSCQLTNFHPLSLFHGSYVFQSIALIRITGKLWTSFTSRFLPPRKSRRIQVILAFYAAGGRVTPRSTYHDIFFFFYRLGSSLEETIGGNDEMEAGTLPVLR